MAKKKTEHDPTSVGAIRELIKGLPDGAQVLPDWANGPPGDGDPAVAVRGFEVKHDEGRPYLSVLVDIEYLNEDEDDDGI